LSRFKQISCKENHQIFGRIKVTNCHFVYSVHSAHIKLRPQAVQGHFRILGKDDAAHQPLQNALYRRTISIVLKAVIILIFRYRLKEFTHMLLGYGAIGGRHGICDI
jgi:hypothetical protein